MFSYIVKSFIMLGFSASLQKLFISLSLANLLSCFGIVLWYHLNPWASKHCFFFSRVNDYSPDGPDIYKDIKIYLHLSIVLISWLNIQLLTSLRLWKVTSTIFIKYLVCIPKHASIDMIYQHSTEFMPISISWRNFPVQHDIMQTKYKPESPSSRASRNN